ncbi:MAG TPA: uracil-DNA glycosylase [Thermoplasmata archaeon]|nr:uracil-DNA glycosylase [Thermoplasmata archaeon]
MNEVSRHSDVANTVSGRPARRTPRARVRAEWNRLSRTIRACQLCPLGAVRTQAVVYRGGPAPRVVFIGEAPGAEEDRTGLPFVGRSGRELDRAVGAIGLPSEEYGVLNVLKCRPPANRFDPSAARTCRPYLDRQLELLRPDVIVTLGARALRTIDPTAPPMLEAAGRPRTHGGISHFPLIHPAAALRSRRLRERWEHDVQSLGRWLAERPA